MTAKDLEQMYPAESRWVRVGMHHDSDYWKPIGYEDDGYLVMQRFSVIQHVPIGPSEVIHPSRLERVSRIRQ